MRYALHAEWTKLRTLASTFWLLLATAVREAAASIGVALGLLYLFPIIAAAVGNPDLARHTSSRSGR